MSINQALWHLRANGWKKEADELELSHVALERRDSVRRREIAAQIMAGIRAAGHKYTDAHESEFDPAEPVISSKDQLLRAYKLLRIAKMAIADADALLAALEGGDDAG